MKGVMYYVYGSRGYTQKCIFGGMYYEYLLRSKSDSFLLYPPTYEECANS